MHNVDIAIEALLNFLLQIFFQDVGMGANICGIEVFDIFYHVILNNSWLKKWDPQELAYMSILFTCIAYQGCTQCIMSILMLTPFGVMFVLKFLRHHINMFQQICYTS